jgi:hypothetical protein
MAKMFRAETEIHRTVKPGVAKSDKGPAKKPEIEVIKAGTIFDPGDETEDLMKTGAIRELSSEEVKKAEETGAQTLDTGRRGRRSLRTGATTEVARGGRRGARAAGAPADTAPGTKGAATLAEKEGKKDATQAGVRGARKANAKTGEDDLVG